MKRFSIILMCILICFSFVLAGCGNNSDNNNNQNQNEANENNTNDTDDTQNSNDNKESNNEGVNSENEEDNQEGNNNEDNEEAFPFGKYEETITLTGLFSTGDLIDNTLATSPGETPEDNRWIELIKKELNINVEYDAVLSGETMQERLNVMIASGDIPDFLNVGTDLASQLAAAELIQPMGEVFDKYASETVKKIHELDRYMTWDPFVINGKRMAIPQVGLGEPIGQTSMMWIRRDWLEDMNLDMPETAEEVIDTVKAFANSKEERVGIGARSAFFGPNASFNGFYEMLGAYPDIWIEDGNGDIKPGLLEPEVKEALTLLQELYSEGVIDQEFNIKGNPQYIEDVVNGRIGFMFGLHAFPLNFSFAAAKEEDPETDWVAVTIPGVPQYRSPAGSVAGVVVNKDCEYPEAAMKMINLHAYMQNDSTEEESKRYVREGAAQWTFVCPVPSPLIPKKNLLNAKAIKVALEEGDIDAGYESIDGLTTRTEYEAMYNNVKKYIDTKDNAMYPWYILFGPEGSQHVLSYYWDNDILTYDKFLGPPTETMTEKSGILSTMRDEIFVRIIMGDADIDEFDTFVEDYLAVGGQDIIDEVNVWYDSYLGE